MPVFRVTDALGHELVLARPARRVVSLVPSETESVVALRGVEVLVGRTTYCTEPRGTIEHVTTCGGTKDVDVDAVLALSPDLVLANQEENARKPIEALCARGAPVHVSFPKTVADGGRYVRTLASLLGLDPERTELVQSTERAVDEAEAGLSRGTRRSAVPTFTPIWWDPLMTFGGGAFASDVLRLAGATNVFADRDRRYPLAADLGRAVPLPKERIGERDTRYPRVTLDEVRARAPRLVLLPDEPYVFTETHAQQLREQGIDGAIEFVDGKNLFWYGTRIALALPALRALVDRQSA